MKTRQLQTFALSIALLLIASCVNDPILPENHHPEILSWSVEGNGIPVRTAGIISCEAEDPDGDSLVLEWTVPMGEYEQFANSIIWTAPDEYATYPFHLRITDGRGGWDELDMFVQVFDYDTLYLPHERLLPGIRFPNDTLLFIETEDEYLSVWNMYGSVRDGNGNLIPPAEVNFDSVLVAVVSAGYGDVSGCVEDVTFIDFIYSIRDSVFVQLTSRGWGEINPDGMHCFTIIEPRHWVTIRKTGFPISFTGSIR